ARKHSLHLVVGLAERDRHLVYNVAVLIGSDGQIIGKYRKVALPRTEIEAGVAPGNEYPVFQTRFGKVGMMVCYDGFFPEVAGESPELRLQKLLEYADRMGIARLCIFMGMQWSYDPTPEKMRQENDEVLQALRHFPNRAFGFVYLNPKHRQASLDELNRCVRD